MWCLRCRLCCIKITISSYPDKMKGNISFPSGDRTIRFQFYTLQVDGVMSLEKFFFSNQSRISCID